MATQTLVRPAAAADLATCARLIAAHEGGAPAEWQERLAQHLSDPGGMMAVAVEGARVVGYGRVQLQAGNPMQAQPPLPGGLYLSGVVVAETHRHRGIASSLCEGRIAWAAERVVEVWYFTNRENAASRALHRRVGFAEVQEFSSPRLDGGSGVLGHRLTRG